MFFLSLNIEKSALFLFVPLILALGAAITRVGISDEVCSFSSSKHWQFPG